LHIEAATAPRDNTFVLKSQLQTTQGNFESSRTFIVADEQIRHAQPEGIQCAGRRNTKPARTCAAEILHRSKKTRALNNHAHRIVILNTVKDLTQAD
jgi:hypothetical protein